MIRVSGEELQKADNATSVVLNEGGYAAGLGISHNLHCLVRLTVESLRSRGQVVIMVQKMANVSLLETTKAVFVPRLLLLAEGPRLG